MFSSVLKPIEMPLFVCLSLIAGCRLAIDDDTDFPTDIAPFDASTDDSDGGVPPLCPDGALDLFNNAYSPYFGGDESVDLEVVQFSSFNCPHCAEWAQISRALWESRPDFQARVRVHFHNFMVFGSESELERHLAAAAAFNQGNENFWKMHDLIFDGYFQNPAVSYTLEDLTAYARDVLKLDMDRFNADVSSKETLSFLYWDMQQGLDAGVTGTPSIYLCGEKVLDRDKIEEIIDSYLGN